MTLAQTDQILVKRHDSFPSGCGQLKKPGPDRVKPSTICLKKIRNTQ